MTDVGKHGINGDFAEMILDKEGRKVWRTILL